MALLLAWLELGGTVDEAGMLLEAATLLEGGTVELTGLLEEAAALLVADELATTDELTLIEDDGSASDELATTDELVILDELPMLEELPGTEDDGTADSTPASCANVLNGIATSWPVTSSTNFSVLSQQSSLQQSFASGSSYAVLGLTPTRFFPLLSVVVAVSGLNQIFAMSSDLYFDYQIFFSTSRLLDVPLTCVRELVLADIT